MAAKKPRVDSTGKSESLRVELIQEMSDLRTLFRDIVCRYQSILEAEMVWCTETLSNMEEEIPAFVNDPQQLKQAIEKLKNLKFKLKPKKGRLKDIRQIDKAINLLSKKLDE